MDDPDLLMNVIHSIFKNIENIRMHIDKNKFEQLSRDRFVCQTQYNSLSKKNGSDMDHIHSNSMNLHNNLSTKCKKFKLL